MQNQGAFSDGSATEDEAFTTTEPEIVAEFNTSLQPEVPVSDSGDAFIASAQSEEEGKEKYVLVKDSPTLIYARFNTLSPVITRVDGKILLRVVDKRGGWVKALVPGGIPGWVRTEDVKITKGVVEIIRPTVSYADPTADLADNDIGTLFPSTKAQLLRREKNWVRVLLPENIGGWIETWATDEVNAEPEKIAKLWQLQRVELKVEAMATRDVRVADGGSTQETAPSIQQSAGAGSSTGGAAVEPPIEPPRLVADIGSGLDASEADLSPEAEVISGSVVAGSADSSGDVAVVIPETPADRPILSLRKQATAAKADDTERTPEQPKPALQPAVGPESNPEYQVLEQGSILVPALTNLANQGEENAVTIRRTKADNVAVRLGAANNFAVITRLPQDILVDTVSIAGSYAEVMVPGGLPVWIENKEVELRDSRAFVHGNGQNARLEPSTGHDTAEIGKIPPGSILRLIERKEGWLRVLASAWITGWVNTRDLAEVGSVIDTEEVWIQQKGELLSFYAASDPAPQPTAALAVETSELPQESPLTRDELITTGLANDNNWLFEGGSEKYTLQLFSMRDLSSAPFPVYIAKRPGAIVFHHRSWATLVFCTPGQVFYRGGRQAPCGQATRLGERGGGKGVGQTQGKQV